MREQVLISLFGIRQFNTLQIEKLFPHFVAEPNWMMPYIIARTVGQVVKLARRFAVLNKIARLAEDELGKLLPNLFLSGR